MLAGARFGNNVLLAHALGQEHLSEDVIDLVRSGVVEVFTLEVDLQTEGLGHSRRKVQRRGTT